jgi:ATP-dependent RNA helicase DHX57
MYEPDPFEARKALEAKHAKANTKKEEAQSNEKDKRRYQDQNVSPEFANAPEVKMATNLRELVEASIKKVGSYDDDISALQLTK